MKHPVAKRIRWSLITDKMPNYCTHSVPAYYFGKNWRQRPTLHCWPWWRLAEGQRTRKVAYFMEAYVISIYNGKCYARRTQD
jgi:hypothetical protein